VSETFCERDSSSDASGAIRCARTRSFGHVVGRDARQRDLVAGGEVADQLHDPLAPGAHLGRVLALLGAEHQRELLDLRGEGLDVLHQLLNLLGRRNHISNTIAVAWDGAVAAWGIDRGDMGWRRGGMGWRCGGKRSCWDTNATT
jgi:hypothetical protein